LAFSPNALARGWFLRAKAVAGQRRGRFSDALAANPIVEHGRTLAGQRDAVKGFFPNIILAVPKNL
jgi:hypothetical protein